MRLTRHFGGGVGAKVSRAEKKRGGEYGQVLKRVLLSKGTEWESS